MKLKLVGLCAGVCAVAIAACSKSPSSPTSSKTAAPVIADAAAAADGSTLKVTAPAPQSPVGGVRLEQQPNGIALVTGNATAKFAATGQIFYHFQVHNAAGANLVDAQNVPAGASTTSYVIPSNVSLEGDQVYSWRVRATSPQTGGVGPWSATNTFIAPQNDGYIRGAELYDPLVNGKTVGRVTGPHVFIPGVGLRFHSQVTLVTYELQQTLTEGEFSLIVTDMDKNTDGDKTKLFSMAEGYDDIVTNNRRMTIEKRGDPAGVVAWRLITHGDQVDTEGPEREEVNFSRTQAYYWQATWRNNQFRVLIREGGVDGRTVYDKAKHFVGRAYDPVPHVVYLGAPVGRSGESGASVDNVTYRQIWVSGRARPGFAR